MLTPEQFKQAREDLLGIVTKQASITTKADLGDKTVLTQLNNASSTLEDDTLKVLVMGKFNGGKSTLLNAIMGEQLLPTKHIPTTAVIGEIVYADQAEAVLYPKPGYSGGTDPFAVDIKDLSKYIVIDHSIPENDEAKKPNPFQKVVIKYPLSICKHGIMFIDSPGLDDPTCHDAITKDYLPNADAIVYCMNATLAFSATDKIEIEKLVALGYRSIIFVLTYFDLIKSNDEMMGTHEAEEVRKHYTQLLSQYTDLGTSGIFFVGSLPALNAKKTGDQQLLEKSNFPSLEKRLEEILFNEKGKMKLLRAIYSTRRVNRAIGQHLDDLIDVTNSDRIGLFERINEAQNNLNQAKYKANEIFNSFKISSNNLVQGAKDQCRVFLLDTIIPNIPKWVEEFTPTEEQNISMWHPKRTGTAFAESCVNYVQRRIEAAVATWSADELGKDYMLPQLEALIQQQSSTLEAFEDDLRKARTSLNLAIDRTETSNQEVISDGNRILSAIAGAFLNPASLVVGGMFGWQGVITSFVTVFVNTIVLSILGIAITWPVAIIVYVVSALIAGKIEGYGVEDKVKKSIAKKLSDEITNQQETLVATIGSKVVEVVEKMQIAVEESLYAPVGKLEKVLEEAQNRALEEGGELQQRKNTYTVLKTDNVNLADDMDEFAQDMNI